MTLAPSDDYIISGASTDSLMVRRASLLSLLHELHKPSHHTASTSSCVHGERERRRGGGGGGRERERQDGRERGREEGRKRERDREKREREREGEREREREREREPVSLTDRQIDRNREIETEVKAAQENRQQ